MDTKATPCERLEFSMPRRDNLLLVENHGDRVVIKATRDNLSLRDKSFFIRYLAAEGYIPEAHRRFADSEFEGPPPVTWLSERAGFSDIHSPKKALRSILRLVGCVALGWALLMVLAFIHASVRRGAL